MRCTAYSGGVGKKPLLGNLALACLVYCNDHTSMEKAPYHSTARGNDSSSTS
jgi:hypothetical protein